MQRGEDVAHEFFDDAGSELACALGQPLHAMKVFGVNGWIFLNTRHETGRLGLEEPTDPGRRHCNAVGLALRTREGGCAQTGLKKHESNLVQPLVIPVKKRLALKLSLFFQFSHPLDLG